MDIRDMALQAQRDSIKSWLQINFVGGAKSVAKWNDRYFHLAEFNASRAGVLAGITTDHARRMLDRLAKDSVIKRMKTYGPVSYRFPRKTCDRLASEVTAELLASGLEMRE